MRPRLALCVLLASALSASLAEARPGPQVDLELHNCPGLSVPAVRRILAAELGTPLASGPGAGVTTALVACQDSIARLRVTDPLSRKVVTRHIDVGDAAPKARARLIAIAISELVLASWSELETNPEPRVEPAGPPPPPQARAAARHWVRQHSQYAARGESDTGPAPEHAIGHKPRRRTFRLLAVISQRKFFSHPGVLWGGGVRLGAEPLSHVSWSLDAVLDRGKLDSPIGRYEIETATLGAAVYFYERWSWLSARVGGGLRVGVARSVGLAGAQTAGTSGLAPWGWPLAALSLSARPVQPLVIELAGETSYVVLPLSGDKSSVRNPSLSGAWYGVELGVGIDF